MAIQQKLLESDPENLGYASYFERKTDELLFVLVEPIGGGAKHVVEQLKDMLKTNYAYEINDISVRNIIVKEAGASPHCANIETHLFLRNIATLSERAKEINKLQQWGNSLRKSRGKDFLAKKVIQKIFKYRSENGGHESAGGIKVAKPLRVAHIVRSIKNTAELALLKSVYGQLMILVGVSGTYAQQVENFRPSTDSKTEQERIEEEYDALLRIDQNEDADYGQQVRKIFYKSDLFLSSQLDVSKEKITHFLSLLFSTRIISPTLDERMMFEAFAASMRSTCLSRQVGAAIADENGDILSIGWNDVPAYRGGVSTDNDSDQRITLCKYKQQCRSDVEKKELLKRTFEKLKSEKLLIQKTSFEAFVRRVSDVATKDLIEFSRAIHAEMEAILNVARMGKSGLKKATLYVTTYPCDNCVKHIIASGIARVVYIEPYPKSRANDFFSDLIVEDDAKSTDNDGVRLSKFFGIAPTSYITLFQMCGARKEKDGELVKPLQKPMPRNSMFLDSYTLYETKIAKEASSEEM